MLVSGIVNEAIGEVFKLCFIFIKKSHTLKKLKKQKSE